MKEIVLACSSVRSKNLSNRVKTALAHFERNNEVFRTTLRDDLLHTFRENSVKVPGLTDIELKWLYKNQLARAGRPAYLLYEKIMRSARFGLCSYCQYGQAKTLDHFIPKDFIPAFSIDPWNLVPCCHQCNHELGTQYSDQHTEQLLHPYSLPHVGLWLRASISPGPPLTVTFFAAPDPSLSNELQERIKNQFDTLGLANLYEKVSGRDTTTIGRTLSRLFSGDEADIVREHLLEQAQNVDDGNDSNDRKRALYAALAESDWYCSGGFSI